MVKIDSTARIDREVVLGEGVEVGPYSILQGKIVVGDHTKIGAFTVIEGRVEIGSCCNIGHHVVVGAPPQDLSYQGEETQVVIGERTTLREFVTVHRATGENNATVIGDDCFIMAYCHVAHNCRLGQGVTMANNSTPGRLCGNRGLGHLEWMGRSSPICTSGEISYGGRPFQSGNGYSSLYLGRWTPGSDFRFKCGGDEKKRDRGRTKGEN